MNNNYNSGVFILDLLLVCFSAIVLVINTNGSLNQLMATMIIIINLIMTYRSRRNWYTLIISLVVLYYNYSICMAEYISVIDNTLFTSYAGSQIADSGIKILLLFSILLYIVMIAVNRQDFSQHQSCIVIDNNKDNNLIVLGLSIILGLIWLFGFGRPEHIGDRGSPSTYFEYSIILIILGFYYSGSSKYRYALFTIISIAYVILNFMYGGRATGIQIIICFLMCTCIDKINRIWLIVGGLAVFFLMTIIGSFRGSWSLNVESVTSTWDSLIDSKFVNDTAFSAYHTSMTFLDYLSYCDWTNRLNLFFRFLLYVFLGGSVANSNLSLITRKFFIHYFGGVLPYYFYFYLGFIGIVIFVVYFYFILSSIVKRRHTSSFWKCAGIYIAATSFRWYIYSPAQITRGLFLFTVAFYALKLLDDLMNDKTMERRKQ